MSPRYVLQVAAMPCSLTLLKVGWVHEPGRCPCGGRGVLPLTMYLTIHNPATDHTPSMLSRWKCMAYTYIHSSLSDAWLFPARRLQRPLHARKRSTSSKGTQHQIMRAYDAIYILLGNSVAFGGLSEEPTPAAHSSAVSTKIPCIEHGRR